MSGPDRASVSLSAIAAGDLRLIVIGGSAGGVEALRALLHGLPARLPCPILVVLHIGAEAKRVWSLVFERSPFAICEAEDKELAQPGTVYIAPPEYHLLVDQRLLLCLSADAPVQLARPSIDVLFESAAWAMGRHVLGIVLSGANADGAAGLAAIDQVGGRCWVQSPESAVAPAMPVAAIRAVPHALISSPGDMAMVLQRSFGEVV